jgi:hypothetical protein
MKTSKAPRTAKSTLGHASKNKIFATQEDLRSLREVLSLLESLKKKGGVSQILAGEINEALGPYRVKSVIR